MRDTWVDYAKALGIILVVTGHVNRGLYSSGIYISKEFFILLDSVIYTFHMPLFFFLSGLFFVKSIDKNGKKKFFINKLDTIFYPYILWSLLQGGIEVILSKYTNSKTTLVDVLSFFIYPRAQFWFLYALFMVFIVAGLIYNKNNFNKSLPIILIISFFAYISTNIIGKSFHADYISNYIVFFFIGCLYKNLSTEKSTSFMSNWFLILTIFIIFCSMQYIFHIIMKLTYTDTGVATFIIAITGIIFISLLSMRFALMKIKPLETIGTLSMVIYLVHILAGSGSRIILSKVFHIQNWYIQIIFGTIIGIGAPIIFYALTKKLNINFLFSLPKRSKSSNK
ncbi:acyltransferase family protein [Raoultella ornithinolytica]|uniref:acyltransferase family protein n=1 Tax=Raoultella ornithinolytica TaxID=54291 RepID=UPI0035900BED